MWFSITDKLFEGVVFIEGVTSHNLDENTQYWTPIQVEKQNDEKNQVSLKLYFYWWMDYTGIIKPQTK